MRVILTFLPTSARLYASMLNGIIRRIGKQYELQTIDYDVSDGDLRKLLEFWNPCGCIIVGAEGIRNLTPRFFKPIPVVYFDRTPMTSGKYLDVVQDYEENGQFAARELLQGDLYNYAFVGNKHPTNWSDIRGKSFASAIRLQGKSCQIFDKGIATCNRPKLLESWLLALSKPVALFAANDRTAVEVLNICIKNKIRVPEDISLLGIDNVENICENTVPTLSSIHCDFEQGGWLCADLLIERIANPSLRRALRTYPTLGVIQRGSTRKNYGNNIMLTRVINLIRARACDDLSVKDIAAEMGCSLRMAEKRFFSTTGETIKSAITQARLEYEILAHQFVRSH